MKAPRAYLEMRHYDSDLPLQCWSSESFSFRAHWHNEVELMFVEDGAIVAGVNQEKRHAGAGSLIVAASNDIHYYEKAAGRVLLMICKPEFFGTDALWPKSCRLRSPFSIPQSPGDILPAAATTYGNKAAKTAATLAEAESSPVHTGTVLDFRLQIRDLMRSIIDELSKRHESYRQMVKAYAIQIMSLVERNMGTETGYDGSTRIGRMQAVLDYLHAHATQNLTMEQVAARANMSPTHFSRVFAKTVGMHFRPYLNELRVELAEESLRTSDKPVTQIALDSGFESLRTFHRAFRRSRGTRPGRLRRS